MAEQSPEEAVRGYEDAFKSGNLDALIAFHESGVTLLPRSFRDWTDLAAFMIERVEEEEPVHGDQREPTQ
jgi:hypothetical protein